MKNVKLRKVVDSLQLDNPNKEIVERTMYSKGQVSSYLNGRIKASRKFLNKFAEVFKIDVKDITDPKAENEAIEDTSDVVLAPPSKSGKRKAGEGLVPYFELDFAAGNDIITLDPQYSKPDYYMDVPEFAGCTAFRAYSDSMERLIKSGSILFGTKIDEWQRHLEYGQIYGLICTDGRRYLKYIRREKVNPAEYFLLQSENERYDDFELPKTAIRSIWLIHGWLNKRT